MLSLCTVLLFCFITMLQGLDPSKYFVMGGNPVILAFYKVVVFPNAIMWAYSNESDSGVCKIITCIHSVWLQRG